MHALGARGAGRERVEAPLVEGAYGIPHRLRSAPKVFGDLRRSVSAGARKQDLAPAHHEGIFGAQPGFEPFALLFRQIPDKNWRFHGGNYRLLHTTLSEDALGRIKRVKPTERKEKAHGTYRGTSRRPDASAADLQDYGAHGAAPLVRPEQVRDERGLRPPGAAGRDGGTHLPGHLRARVRGRAGTALPAPRSGHPQRRGVRGQEEADPRDLRAANARRVSPIGTHGEGVSIVLGRSGLRAGQLGEFVIDTSTPGRLAVRY